VIFAYSATLQILSIIVKHQVTSNLVIRLREDSSPISNRKESNETENNVTSNESLEERTNHDERLGKSISARKGAIFYFMHRAL
jgi:hypothetical protein